MTEHPILKTFAYDSLFRQSSTVAGNNLDMYYKGHHRKPLRQISFIGPGAMLEAIFNLSN